MSYRNCKLLLCLLSLYLVGGKSVFAQPSELFCVVREVEEVEVPAKRDGIISAIYVRRGEEIQVKQRLLELDKTDKELQMRVTEAELAQAKIRAKNDGEVEASKAAVEQAKLENRLLEDLGKDAVYLEKFRKLIELRKASADLRSSSNRFEQDQLLVRIKEGELAVIRNDIAQTIVSSPVTGIVQELLKEEGEWVQQGQPVMTVTRLDRLLAEGFVDSADIAPHKMLGKSVTAVFQVAGTNEVKLRGLVVKHGPPKLELDGKYPVWVEFENFKVQSSGKDLSWVIRPGMRGRILLDSPGQVSAPKSKTANLQPAKLTGASQGRSRLELLQQRREQPSFQTRRSEK